MQVFPELKAWCTEYRIQLTDVDLRRNTDTDKTTLEVCLEEINRADVFVGIIGSRYGKVLAGFGGRPYLAPPDVEHDWLLSYPPARGLLEIDAARVALNRKSERAVSIRRALFYERDNSFLSSVPESAKSQFLDGGVVHNEGAATFVADETRSALLEQLRGSVREAAVASGAAVLSAITPEEAESNAKLGVPAQDPRVVGSIRVDPTPFTCTYRKVVELADVPQVQELDAWGARVVADLKAAVAEIYPLDEVRSSDDLASDRLHHVCAGVAASDALVGRDDAVQALFSIVTSAGPQPMALVVLGDGGVGKTAMLGALTKRIESSLFAELQAVCAMGAVLCYSAVLFCCCSVPCSGCLCWNITCV